MAQWSVSRWCATQRPRRYSLEAAQETQPHFEFSHATSYEQKILSTVSKAILMLDCPPEFQVYVKLMVRTQRAFPIQSVWQAEFQWSIQDSKILVAYWCPLRFSLQTSSLFFICYGFCTLIVSFINKFVLTLAIVLFQIYFLASPVHIKVGVTRWALNTTVGFSSGSRGGAEGAMAPPQPCENRS